MANNEGRKKNFLREPFNSMDQEEVLRRVEEEVKREMMGREGSHDFHHVERVVALALKLAEEEGAEASCPALSLAKGRQAMFLTQKPR